MLTVLYSIESASLGELIQRIQQGGFFSPVLQDPRLVFVIPVEIGEDFRIPRPDLGDGVVQQPSSAGRTFLYDIQVVRAKQHRVEGLRQFSGGLSHSINQDPFRGAAPQLDIHGLIPPVAVYVRQNIRGAEVEAYQFPVKPRSEALSAGQEIHRLEKIGFPLGVLPRYDIGFRGELHRFPLIVSPSGKRDPFYDHRPFTLPR